MERLSDRWISKLEQLHAQDDISETDAHRLAAEHLADIAGSTLVVEGERGLRLLDRASNHAARVPSSNLRLRLQSDVLRTLLGRGGTELWEDAVRRSLEFGDAIFRTFDRFGRRLLELRARDAELPTQLLETIGWAEDLMRL